MLEILQPAKTADAAESAKEDASGFSIRFCPGPRANLRYQAGDIVHESRDYIGPGMATRFMDYVTLFHLRGHGETREEAIAMAENGGGR